MATTSAATTDVAALLALAIAEPAAARTQAEQLLATQTDPATLSAARQALGIVLRGEGRLDDSLVSLREAIAWSRKAHDADREADVRATLGVTLAMAGRTRSGISQLDRATAMAHDPLVLAKVLMRRGHVHYFVLRRAQAALDDLHQALAGFRRSREPLWEARTLNLIGLSALALGRIDEAASSVAEAERAFDDLGQLSESVVTVHNRGYIAYCTGDLPRALRLYDEAHQRYARLGEDSPELANDQGDALLSAGLLDEAVTVLVRRLATGGLAPSVEAEAHLALAAAELAADRSEAAIVSAQRAQLLFARQRRDWWVLRARLVVLLARQHGGVSRLRLEAVRQVAEGLEAAGLDEAVTAWLLAGQTAARRAPEAAVALLERAVTYRTRRSEIVRVSAWHAAALAADLRGRHREVLVSCREGLDALDVHRSVFGSTELRALATRPGDQIATLALRHALRDGPRAVLEWAERRRAGALAQPPVRPPDDAELARDLAALRDLRRRIADARAEQSPAQPRLEEESARLERAIRRRAHYLGGDASFSSRFDASRLVDSLGEATFVELVDIDGALHALVARHGRVRHVVVGASSDAEQTASYARFALRQAARGRPSDLAEVGRRVQESLLGDASRLLGDGPVVVSPTSRLHAAPWALAPVLAAAPVTVVPSAALWLRAHAAPRRSGARVLVAGPGLESGGAEIDALAASHPEAVLLRHGTATVERTLQALDGAAVAHVAAHGHFREDSPMFSALDLDDGPLTVHDLERLATAPHRMVLSACESGVMAPIGAGELLGLVAAMLSMGSAGVVSTVAKVNDHATADLMVHVHDALDTGAGLGEVLLRTRRAARGDPVHEATAAAFSAMGV